MITANEHNASREMLEGTLENGRKKEDGSRRPTHALLLLQVHLLMSPQVVSDECLLPVARCHEGKTSTHETKTCLSYHHSLLFHLSRFGAGFW